MDLNEPATKMANAFVKGLTQTIVGITITVVIVVGLIVWGITALF